MAKKTFTLSDDSVNSYGFSVLTSGINWKQFKRNPVMLFNHNRDNATGPIGRWENLRVEDGKLMGDADFDMQDPVGKEISRKVDDGYIKGASLGLCLDEIDDSDANNVLITKSSIREISVCDIPSNNNSLVLYDNNGEALNLSDKNSFVTLFDTILKSQKQNPIMKHLLKFIALFATINIPLSDSSTEEVIFEETKKVIEKNTTLTAEVKTLTDELAIFKDKATKAFTASVAELVDNAIKNKVILATEKESYIALATADYANTKKILDSKKAPLKPSDLIGRKVATGETKTDLADKDNWDFKTWSKKDPEGLAELEKNEPEQFHALLDGIANDVRGRNLIDKHQTYVRG